MTPIAFTVPAVPIAQPRQRHAVRGGFAKNYTPSKHPVQAFKATVRLAYAQAAGGVGVTAEPIALRVTFVMPRPKNQHWKTKPTPRYGHTKKPDIDNLLKSLKDALTGLAWVDDSQVCAVEARKFVAAGDESPHVSVQICAAQ